MKTFSQKTALAFAIINTLPAFFGIVMISILIPIPGLILYVFYWLAWKKKITLNGERFIWLGTIIYNLFLFWLGKIEKDFYVDEWVAAFQIFSAVFALFALTSTYFFYPSETTETSNKSL